MSASKSTVELPPIRDIDPRDYEIYCGEDHDESEQEQFEDENSEYEKPGAQCPILRRYKMSYPWYATGVRYAGSNHRVSVSAVENCRTGEIAYKLDVMVLPGIQSYTATVKSPEDFEGALEKILIKRAHDDADILWEDVKQLATFF